MKDQDNGAPNGASMSEDRNPNQPTDRQVYFGEALGLSVPAIVKLNKTYGRVAVLSAMEQIHGFPPPDDVVSNYAYVATVASFKVVGS